MEFIIIGRYRSSSGNYWGACRTGWRDYPGTRNTFRWH